MTSFSDTIAAVATPPGEGAIGIIRLSGSDAISITNAIFKGKDLSRQPSHTLHFGRITDGVETVDEVVVSLYRNPKSYTGEDVTEISCHGSIYVLRRVMALCLAHGARAARPGEFTLRAFLNGKMDLTQAEAVADIIASESEAAHKAAMHNLRGGFTHDLAYMREQLITFSALIELELDFSEEDVEFADRKRFYQLLSEMTDATQQLLQSFSLGNVIKNGVSVAIIGKPNAGKSTLLNALLNEERAIVSDIAGTTRDTIEETLNINGVLFRIIDTAGIREHTADVIEQQGIARSRAAMEKADVVVHLADVSTDMPGISVAGPREILVGNKADLASPAQLENARTAFPQMLLLSARNRDNIQQLKDALFNIATGGGLQHEGTIITNARHYGALQQVLQSLHDIKAGLDHRRSGDLIALDIRTCLHYLGEITGEITTEDKLDYIFSKFCIGK